MKRLLILKSFLCILILVVPFCIQAKTEAKKKPSFDCEEMITKYKNCEASQQFIFSYRKLCRMGNEISPADRLSMHAGFQEELATNHCLAKIYKPPKTNRKVRNKERSDEVKAGKKQAKVKAKPNKEKTNS